ncbi:hypothetical protein GGU10DRAFT_335128 [Lentinula aff. detonsa]|uniref:Uncharacterized protein n=1 Tax=Lentinula aff. detonsa TaxID=2804958 RepID=A0AA38KEL7_9AGAR|nr:hypothetical protein GGU10DRAFT_335128 [Lentinula aff. detonsa]
MLFSISYVLLGLIAVIHAIPIDSGITYPSPCRQTAPSHPPRAVKSLLDPRHTHPRPQPHSEPLPKDDIYVGFVRSKPRGTVPRCEDARIKKEITLIIKGYRRHLNIGRPFEISFHGEYDCDGDIHNNLHDFIFWGEGMGGDCEGDPTFCRVQYDEPLSSTVDVDPKTRLADMLIVNQTGDKRVVFGVTGTHGTVCLVYLLLELGCKFKWTTVNFTNYEKDINEEKTLGIERNG